MNWFLSIAGAVALFLAGLRLSAFFSGSETGFYRLSFVRLNLDAQSGDETAARLLWFSRNPSRFVATTLIGNNVANYVTTLAIGLFAAHLFSADLAGSVEIAMTILMSPVIFIFGELIPKNLYYRSPMYLLRRDSRVFWLFYQMFRVFSWPLVGIARFLEKLGGDGSEQRDIVLGRNRLVQVLSHGHREGLLSDVQSRLIHGVLHTASLNVIPSVTPIARTLGLPDTADGATALQFARDYGLANVLIRRADNTNGWYGYVQVSDLLGGKRMLPSVIREMPEVDGTLTRLETLARLREAGATFALVKAQGEIIGTVNEAGLIEQLFRSPHLSGAPAVSSEAIG